MRLLKPSLNSFLRNKKKYVYILSIVVMITILANILYIQYQINNIYCSKIENNIKNRILSISKNINPNQEVDIPQISNINTIKEVYVPVQNIEVIMDEKYKINLQTIVEEEMPNVFKGKSISNMHKDIIEIIIPNKLETNEYKIEQLLNTYVTLKYESMKISAKIVGIYNDSTNRGTAYISRADIIPFCEYNKNLIRENSYMAIIDNYKNVNNTIDKLTDMGYSANIYDQSGQNEIRLYNMVSNVLKILIYLITIFIYVLVSVIINSMIVEEKNDIAIFKAIGYKNIDLLKIIIVRLIFVSIISYCISILISLGINCLINFILFKTFHEKVSFSILIHLKYTIMPLLIVLLINILSAYVNSKKIKNISIINLLKEE